MEICHDLFNTKNWVNAIVMKFLVANMISYFFIYWYKYFLAFFLQQKWQSQNKQTTIKINAAKAISNI